MADSICRALRDGALDGEHAPALTIKDYVDSPFGPLVFNHVFTQLAINILAGKSQSQGIVLVALSHSPSFYFDLLKSCSIDVASLHKWIRVVDCYTDPLGWKGRLVENGSISVLSLETSNAVRLFNDLKNLESLSSLIIELGKELIGQGKGRFSVAIDSATDMLRQTSVTAVATLVSNLRSHEQVSTAFWSLHSDLHETRVTAVLEYMSSMLASIESLTRSANGKSGNSDSFSMLEQNSRRGKFHVRLKRRNGRVRLMCEDFCIEQSGIKFSPVSSTHGVVNQSLVPKVQFNLQLSEKERDERAKVVLPFEHQDHGKTSEIYDGRRSLNETSTTSGKLQQNEASGNGEIIYYRDSDDEMPDSDEDPDDDLDI